MKIQISNKFIRNILIFLNIFIISCDFTPTLHKTILEAQNKIGQQEYQEAVDLYESIIQGYLPKDIRVKIYYQLGELYSIHLGKNKEALKYYKKIGEVTEDPLWQVKVEEKIGDINFNYLKNYDESIKSYTKLTQFRPKLNKLDYYELQLGLSYLHSEKYEKALEIFKSIERNQGHEFYVRSFYYLGLINFEQKEWARSIGYWKEYIKREKRKDSVIQTKFLMANAYETMENLKSAYNLYYSLLGEYPNTQVLQNRLSSIYERQVARKR